MLDGTTEPDETVADLDQWRLRHLEESHGARRNARNDGIEDRVVSVNLPEHTLVTVHSCWSRGGGRHLMASVPLLCAGGAAVGRACHSPCPHEYYGTACRLPLGTSGPCCFTSL
jgi:hypothetical protein